MTFRRVSWVVFSGCLLAACGGGGGGALTLDQYVTRATDVICTINVRCGSVPDRASCYLDTDVSQVKADVNAGKTKYDGVAAAECLDALETYDCSRSNLLMLIQAQACQGVAVGTVADGSPCSVSTQCASLSCTLTQASCDRDTTCCAGTCAPTRATVAEGGDCSGAGKTCAVGLYCDMTVPAPTCVKRLAEGAACSSGKLCLETLRCAQAAGAAGGTCATYPKRGETCTDAFSTCNDQHDFCDPTTGTCIARLAVGASCTGAAQGCVSFAPCDATSHQCVKTAGPGQACTDKADCLGSLVCANGKCAAPPPQIVCP